LASSIKSGEVATLRVALSETVDLAILIPYVDELRKHHKHLELKLLRGTADDAAECLKEGEAEFAQRSHRTIGARIRHRIRAA
jgi:DNA-binding transcriptional LysR family regulator